VTGRRARPRLPVDTITTRRARRHLHLCGRCGQRAATVAQVPPSSRSVRAQVLRFIVSATASEPAPLLVHRPYAPPRCGEYFMNQGKDVCWWSRRSLEARLGLPADLAAAAPATGREAYPGDVFYLALAAAERSAAHEQGERRWLADPCRSSRRWRAISPPTSNQKKKKKKKKSFIYDH